MAVKCGNCPCNFGGLYVNMFLKFVHILRKKGKNGF